MVRKVLTDAGFIEGKTFKETRFIQPPETTYALFMNSYTSRGSDYRNLVKENNSTVELYSYKPDPNAELKIENSLDKFGIEYEKSDRLWIESEQLYEVVYTFNYIEK
jgi:hypothetical protein